jgi:hypothetical protein
MKSGLKMGSYFIGYVKNMIEIPKSLKKIDTGTNAIYNTHILSHLVFIFKEANITCGY